MRHRAAAPCLAPLDERRHVLAHASLLLISINHRARTFYELRFTDIRELGLLLSTRLVKSPGKSSEDPKNPW